MSDPTPTADKRTVATDALATLGTIIDASQKRDAIHLAVEPAVAAHNLSPGDRVRVIDGKAFRANDGDAHGIVDPFLGRRVQQDQRFWLVLMPRTIHSLRHVWTHPEFPDEPGVSAEPVAKPTDAAASERWLRDWCSRNDTPGYDMVMAAIRDEPLPGNEDCDEDDKVVARRNDYGDGERYILFIGRDAHATIPPEFWTHIEAVLGRKVEDKDRATGFTCSC